MPDEPVWIAVVPRTGPSGGHEQTRSHLLRQDAAGSMYGSAPRITLCGKDAADWLDWSNEPDEVQCVVCLRRWRHDE